MKYGYQVALKVHTFVDRVVFMHSEYKYSRILFKHRFALNGVSSVYVNYDVNGNIGRAKLKTNKPKNYFRIRIFQIYVFLCKQKLARKSIHNINGIHNKIYSLLNSFNSSL